MLLASDRGIRNAIIMAKPNIDLKLLIESGAHFGHQTKRWNPKMAEYLHGAEDGTHLFDLIKTKGLMETALEAITETSREGKSILILGTKKQSKDKVIEVAKETGVFCVTERWLGGTFTNFPQISKSIQKLTDMKEERERGGYSKFTKKERLMIDREIERLERFFGGIVDMKKVPDLIITIDVKREKAAVIEARMKGVKTVGIVDSNSDPDDVDYPIPMNDDATGALTYVLDLIKEAILEGKKGPKTKSKEPKITKPKSEKPKVSKSKPKLNSKPKTKVDKKNTN